MFGQGNMEQMMKQMGMDMEEVDAARVVVETSDGRELVFASPELHRMEIKGRTMFQLQGEYEERAAGPDQEDVELVMERADVDEDAARRALEAHDDLTEAIMAAQEE